MRSIASVSTKTALPLRARYIAYPIRLDDHDDNREIFVTVVAPAAFHGQDVCESIVESVQECMSFRRELTQSEATFFDLMTSFENALLSRGLQMCLGSSQLLYGYDPESVQIMH